ncbi:class I SAM-dependent methyltransferase [Amylibacter sp.]|jgi:2-polyprenyl-3-methyl-5-hydroxy-6-metoxy-1,4-benzoquinol methylase|nr:class I SAM-dependent methyltransferase [Amylibacter sp.]
MIVIDNSFFDVQGKATSQKRRLERREQLLEMHNEIITPDFMGFGYDYFDNESYVNGYQGYKCDSRYKKECMEIIKFFKIKPHDNILDFGCAKGTIVNSFISAGHDNTYGVDASEYAINSAPNTIKEKLYVIDYNLKFPTILDNLELLICKDVLPHLNFLELDQLFKKLKSICNGSFYFEIQTVEHPNQLYMLSAWDQTHKTCMTIEWWRELLDYYFGEELTVHFKRLV